MMLKSSRFFSAFRRGSIRFLIVLLSSMSFWACSRLFQNFSSAIKESISPRRFCALATSKKPPEMGKLLGGGIELTFDDFKHRRNHTGGAGANPAAIPIGPFGSSLKRFA